MIFRRGQNRYNLSIFAVLFIPLSLFIFLYLGLHFFIYYIFLSKPLTLVLIPTWLSTFFICFKSNFGKIKIERKTKEKVMFYSIFVTFLVFYLVFFSKSTPLILAQTPTTTPPSLPKCNSTSPTVTVLTPLVPSASSLKVSVTFSCQEWNYTIRDLKLTLYIDNSKWNECFLNETAGLVTYFGWNGTQMDDASPHCRRGCQSCGNNGRWDCDNKMNCKFRDADLWVYSNSTIHFVNITFTCKLPPLSPGSHTLTVRPVIYHSLIEMKPSKTTFMVTLSDENSILRALIQPFKVLLRIIFPF